MITLYDYELSGNCYKIRMFLSILGIEYTSHQIDFYPAAEHKSASFLKINPMGTLPVLVDSSVDSAVDSAVDGSVDSAVDKTADDLTSNAATDNDNDNADQSVTLKDSAAILVYLASRYDKTNTWYPHSDAAKIGQITEWLAFADSITASASQARLAEGFFYSVDADTCRQRAHQLFRMLDEHLWFAEQQNQTWLVRGDKPTIADIACFPYIILSEEGSIARQDYPAIRRWTDRVKRIAGFTVMPGVFPAGPDASDQNLTAKILSSHHV